MYRFDHDWFSPNIHNLTSLARGNERNPLNILEIGAFEGRSTTFFADTFMNAHITTIDTWKGSEEHEGNPEIDFRLAESNFLHNISFHKDRITVIKGNSFEVLIDLYKSKQKFDFVFVDGAHDAISVNSDLVLSFKLLNVSGLIYCDDYFWGFNEQSFNGKYYKNFVFDTPKTGIDAFVSVYGDKIRPMVGLTNNAAVFMKVSE